MQKFINIAGLLCVLIVLVIACTVNEGMYGEWRNVSETPFYSSVINIVKLRTKEGANFPYYTLIYDDDYQASACQKSAPDKTICLSLLLKTTKIHPSDEISSVVASPLPKRNYELKTHLDYRLGYTLLHWNMTFPQYNDTQISLAFRRNWF